MTIPVKHDGRMGKSKRSVRRVNSGGGPEGSVARATSAPEASHRSSASRGAEPTRTKLCAANLVTRIRRIRPGVRASTAVTTDQGSSTMSSAEMMTATVRCSVMRRSPICWRRRSSAICVSAVKRRRGAGSISSSAMFMRGSEVRTPGG